MKSLPTSVTRFVDGQQTQPIERILGEPRPDGFPFAEYWHRAIACLLLSGRVRPKQDGLPNRADINRICKEANFDQYLFEHTARLLVKSKIVDPGKLGQGSYAAGKNWTAFWDHDLEILSKAARKSFLDFIDDATPYKAYRPTFAFNSDLDGFARIFVAAFQGLALAEEQMGKILKEFSQLPSEDLQRANEKLAPDGKGSREKIWYGWFDQAGLEALLVAFYYCGWAYQVEYKRKRWIHLSSDAEILLGLRKPPKPGSLPEDLRTLTNQSVFAGAGLSYETLLPLFRYCGIERIDRVLEFKIDPKRLAEQPDTENAVGELRAALEGAGELPPTVEALFSGKPPARGRVGFRPCRALIEPENAEVLTAIREHPSLKRYLDAGAPPGFLLIKSNSNPSNFLARCEELGFDIDMK